MEDIVLYCKSYHRDVLRAKRLAESIRQFNADKLPFYLSCPSSDLTLFRNVVGSDGLVLLADEDIVAKCASVDNAVFRALPGGISQQVVKSEFWRLGICENYLCLDSDSYFIRDCHISDLLTPTGVAFTVMNESLELRLFGALHRHDKIARNIDSDCRKIMEIFGRTGRHYDFGPLPVVWSRRVWTDLAEKFLEPQGMNFVDAMILFPSEMRWYGEALLKYRSIDLWPVETLFRCYHYEEQYRAAREAGENDETLKRTYLGVCVQSNWDLDMNYGETRKSLVSKLNRSFKKRILRRLV